MRNVFIVWDSTLAGVDLLLTELQLDPTAIHPHGVHHLGAGSAVAIGDLDDRILEKLGGCDSVLAIIDHPNANMAWELGLALGHEKAVGLAIEQVQVPASPWWRGFADDQLVQADIANIDVLRHLLGEFNQATIGRRLKPGHRRLVLCPDESTGRLVRERVRALGDPWEVFDPPPFRQLAGALDGLGSIHWILPPAPHGQVRHGTANTRHALISGWARASGIPLSVHAHPGSGVPADIRGLCTAWHKIDGLMTQLREIAVPEAASADVLAHWRFLMLERHRHAPPLLMGRPDVELARIYVQVDLHRTQGRSFTGDLSALLRSPGPHRLVISAAPGAGKTTLVRNLAADLARQADAPLPLLVPLSRLGSDHPFAWAGAELHRKRPDIGADVVVRALQAHGATWLLLDGLDEVSELRAACDRLVELVRSLPAGLPVVVLCREAAADALLTTPNQPFERATLLDLDLERQLQLVHNLADAEIIQREPAARLSADLKAGRFSPQLTRNPLLLTLLAVTAADTSTTSRLHLLQRAVKHLLERGYGLHPTAPRSPETLRPLLRALALAWHPLGRERLPRAEVRALLIPILAACPESWLWPQGADGLLDDLDRHSGVFGRFDGPGSEYGWLHRSLRELLVAEVLAGMADGAREAALAPHLAADPGHQAMEPWSQDRIDAERERFAPWGEVVGLLIALRPSLASELLQPLVAAVPAAAVRCLVACENLAPEEALAWLLACEQHFEKYLPYPAWDNDDLDSLLTTLRRTHDLLELVHPGQAVALVALVHYALGAGVDNEAFFVRWGRPRPAPDASGTVLIDGARTTFTMGSPLRIGDAYEHPAHPVQLSPYRLGIHPVTRAEYGRFDPTHTCPGGDTHPVRRVSWFEARLYAAWVGGRLPTEAEWECACRAGTSTAWSFGDDPAKLAEHGWFKDNGKDKGQPVGQLKPNPWGLYDLHGNVWEWCADRYAAYTADSQQDPAGPDAGGDRVLRGGSAWFDADRCRSACRFGFHPGVRYDAFGFRVALP